MWLFGLALKLFLSNTLAYNLDITNAIIFALPQRLPNGRNSYFGYATALYTSSTNVSAVLIGAPRANTSYHRSVLEPGTVYVCLLNNECKEWNLDKSENEHYNPDNPYIRQIRNNSWTGAVIVTQNRPDPRIMVCAPRWKNIDRNYWLMSGMCYWIRANGIESFNQEANSNYPLMSISYQIYRNAPYYYGMGQVGFSAHMTSNELRWDVALGAPGALAWIGTPVLLTESILNNIQVIIPSVTKEKRRHYNGYFGYSITSGSYFKKQEYWFASGSPRSDEMYGSVTIFNFPDVSDKKLQIKTTKKGQQYGEYFGAALASCDLNNDGKDDLIVGAPLWSRDVDEGRVYIFAWKNNNVEVQTIEGDISGGRFGSTITCLGDIDYDKYSDIVIGAPYEQDSGAIYIYNGNKNGVSKKYSQKILGSQFSQNIRGFGISISEPQDINGDKHLDIAVGAYLSEQVILLTSKPVISITVNLMYSVKKLLRDTKSFSIDICTVYNGVYAPEKLDIVHTLQVDSLYGRAYAMVKSNNSTYILSSTLNTGERKCDTVMIYLKNNIQNLIDPVSISVIVDLSTNNISHTASAVINKLYSKTEDSIELPFIIECGTDDICKSDLQIFLLTNLKSNNTYIIGSASKLGLTINVHNNGEPAYQSQIHIFIPDPLSLASIPPACMESSWINNTLQVICNIGNPLITNETVVLELDTNKVSFDVQTLELYANVTTQSEETNQLDNNYTMTIYFDIDVDIAIAGKAQEDLYSYFQKDEDDEKYPQSIRFQHIYEVQKFGTSPINEAVLIVEIPTHWKSNNYDIELISINQIIAHKDGHFLECIDLDYSKISQTSTIGITNEFDIKNKSVESFTTNVTKNKSHEKLTLKEIIPTNIPPENRTLFINCTNPMILCKQLKCELNSFISSLSVAKLILTLDLNVTNIKLLTLENKDIIYFASKGTVNITQPPNVIQGSTNKPDVAVIATTFLGAPIKERVAGWILALSIFLGILLLIVIILGLLKLGFFHRKKKEELEALKAMSNKKDPIVLETSSSEGILNQE
ncbi:hypothetical protein KPH14_003637 [Odynerus spinipes]|uniref:Uncharacterized protein n=1 Tax=Odynerus spinipes TaxID=1348599 RepID=A0AAD9VJA5_9HYME|nr:hypothetical protein KPH14_003637 [Odynerus spinipes]